MSLTIYKSFENFDVFNDLINLKNNLRKTSGNI